MSAAGDMPAGVRLRRAGDRARSGEDGIATVEAFSRGAAIDRDWMGWGALRVLSWQDWAPGTRGDDTRVANMERLMVVLEGALDADCGALGRPGVGAGEVLWIGAGHGLDLRLANASADAPLRFVDAWLQPDRVNARPSLGVSRIGAAVGGPARATPGWCLVAAPGAAVAGDAAVQPGPLPWRQQGHAWIAELDPGDRASLPGGRTGRRWLEVVAGAAAVDLSGAAPLRLAAGDGLALAEGGGEDFTVASEGPAPTRLLLFALPD